MISLIVHDGICFFVIWEDPAIASCRRVRLDSKCRIIYNVPYMVPCIKVSGCRVVIAETTAVMLKRSAGTRPDMPAWCLALLASEEAALLQGPTAEGQCISCAACVSSGCPELCPVVASVGSLFACVDCTSIWHEFCALRIRKEQIIEWSRFRCPICTSLEK